MLFLGLLLSKKVKIYFHSSTTKYYLAPMFKVNFIEISIAPAFMPGIELEG